MEQPAEGSMTAAILWMLVISLLLFWLPFFGPLIAGVVGGRAAGSVGSAMLAVFLPIVIISTVLFFAGSALTGVPLIGMVAGAGMLVLILANVGPLLLGAIVGGIIA